MIRSFLAGLVAAGVSAHAFALGQGDIAFTAFNADEDGFAIVTFVDLAAGTTIHFSDNEWNGSAFNTGEGQHTWTATAAVMAGTVVRFSKVDQAIRAASSGSLVSSGDTGLNATSETIYAFLGADANSPTVFLAGLSTEGATNLSPAGLTGGTNAVILTNSTDFAEYTGPRTGLSTFASYGGLVNDAGRWNIVVGQDNSLATPNLAPFAPVPEPSTYAMVGLGLIGMGLGLRRRAKD